MAPIRMRTAVRRPKVTAAVGLLGLVAAGSAVGVVSTAAAADQWASHNVYCYQSAIGNNSSREFIRNVHYISATDTIDYVLEHQEWSNGGYARSGGTSRFRDVSGIGGEGALSAFEQGGDPSWICTQFTGTDGWTGVLTTDT